MIGNGVQAASSTFFLFTYHAVDQQHTVLSLSFLLLFFLSSSLVVFILQELAMLARRHVATLLRPSSYHITNRSFSTTLPSRLELAYDLHEPPKEAEKNGPRGNPIIFAHGLFGSKKNNRSMSK